MKVHVFFVQTHEGMTFMMTRDPTNIERARALPHDVQEYVWDPDEKPDGIALTLVPTIVSSFPASEGLPN